MQCMRCGWMLVLCRESRGVLSCHKRINFVFDRGIEIASRHTSFVESSKLSLKEKDSTIFIMNKTQEYNILNTILEVHDQNKKYKQTTQIQIALNSPTRFLFLLTFAPGDCSLNSVIKARQYFTNLYTSGGVLKKCISASAILRLLGTPTMA